MIVSVIATGSKAHTRLSPFVVKTTRPLLIAMPSPPANRFVSATWLRVGVGTPDGSGTVAHASAPTDSVQHLERARREVAPHRRDEAVEPTVGPVLGEVQAVVRRVGGDRLVRERAHRGTRHAGCRADR